MPDIDSLRQKFENLLAKQERLYDDYELSKLESEKLAQYDDIQEQEQIKRQKAETQGVREKKHRYAP